MNDAELVRAFVNTDARRGAGIQLEILGDGLLLDGWWYVGMRISSDSYLVRDEDPPTNCRGLHELPRELDERGLRNLGEADPRLVALTCTELSIGSAARWALWGTDPASANSAIEDRIIRESELSLREAPIHGSEMAQEVLEECLGLDADGELRRWP